MNLSKAVRTSRRAYGELDHEVGKSILKVPNRSDGHDAFCCRNNIVAEQGCIGCPINAAASIWDMHEVNRCSNRHTRREIRSEFIQLGIPVWNDLQSYWLNRHAAITNRSVPEHNRCLPPVGN